MSGAHCIFCMKNNSSYVKKSRIMPDVLIYFSSVIQYRECRVLLFSPDLKWVITFSYAPPPLVFEFTFLLLQPCHHGPFPSCAAREGTQTMIWKGFKIHVSLSLYNFETDLGGKLLTSRSVGRVRTWSFLSMLASSVKSWRSHRR